MVVGTILVPTIQMRKVQQIVITQLYVLTFIYSIVDRSIWSTYAEKNGGRGRVNGIKRKNDFYRKFTRIEGTRIRNNRDRGPFNLWIRALIARLRPQVFKTPTVRNFNFICYTSNQWKRILAAQKLYNNGYKKLKKLYLYKRWYVRMNSEFRERSY